MNAHTPGPWSFIKGSGKLLSRIYDSDGKLVCIFGGPPSDANARLIAAAPEMLLALQTIASRAPHRGTVMLHEEELILITQAITKATGQP